LPSPGSATYAQGKAISLKDPIMNQFRASSSDLSFRRRCGRFAGISGAALVLGMLAASCGGNDTGETDDPVTMTTTPTPSTSTSTPVPTPGVVSPMIVASDANNYAFSSTLSINVTPVQPSSELTFDWSSVTTDFIGHDMDPTKDVGMLSLLMWSLPKDELERKLNADELAQSDLVALAMIYPEDTGITTGSLFDMTSFGMPLEQAVLLDYLNIDDYDPATHTYTIMAVTGTVAGEGTRMIQGFQLDAASTNTQVTMTTQSTGLQYTVDIASAAPNLVPAGNPALSIEWGDMELTSLGTEFSVNNVTEALVAKYPLTVAELEANFLDLEIIAERMYRGPVTSGTSIDLSTLKDANGAAFPGADAGGTWIVALFCGSCANPAPWYLSVLQPM
jgi:hypothetical protein